MGRRVFTSYKYADTQVRALPGVGNKPTRVRDYVNYLEEIFTEIDDLYSHAEDDDSSLQGKSPEYIRSVLTDAIYYTSVTLVFISKGMKTSSPERNQWIPWEISYSLKEISRSGRTSQINGLLLVILPDENSSYEYFVKSGNCGVSILSYDYIFKILARNFHNKKKIDLKPCDDCGGEHFNSSDSFVVWAKWDDFKNQENMLKLIERAGKRGEDSDDYDVVKEI